VTPNTDYVIEGGQYATVLGYGYAPIEEYKKSYRGMVTLWKFDRAKGRIDEANSFALELPPYWQDLPTRASWRRDGFFFINSFNSEMATGGVEKGNRPSRPAPASATWTTCTSSTGRRPRRPSRLARPKDQRVPGDLLDTSVPKASCTSRPSPRARTAWT
jgi:hypothetical protein